MKHFFYLFLKVFCIKISSKAKDCRGAFVLLLCCIALFGACGHSYNAPYCVSFPTLPETWTEILGEPRWKLEWVNAEGMRESFNAAAGERPSVEICQEWASPITAYPYWDGSNGGPALAPGVMRPAGTVFPWGASLENGVITLSWIGGVEAAFYMELARAAELSGETARHPRCFDWRRFRELLESDDVDEEARKDLWRVDWASVADKTVAHSFDRRRIKIAKSETASVPAEGTWIGASPFADPITATDGVLTVSVGTSVDTYVSKNAVLKVTKDVYFFSDF